jgi:three-Cys-motif partner protein
VASDGLPARDNGVWAKDKLSFLDEYAPPALQATTTKLQRFYVDLFAGPGINVDADDTGEEFVGSALRVLPMRSPANAGVFFTSAVLVNKSTADHEALITRLKTMHDASLLPMPWSNLEFLNGDANQVIHRIMRGIPKQAFVLVFADIESPNQLPFDTIRALRSHEHRSVDL